jgi:starch-binding outer membrane protein, SusD/RagB family
MKYKIKIFSLYLVMSFFMISCTESFLDHPITGSVSDENIGDVLGNNPERIASILSNANRVLGGIKLYGREFSYFAATGAHEVDMDWTADLAWNEFSKNDMTSSNEYISSYYSEIYKIISTVNLTIDLVDKMDMSQLTPSQVTNMATYKGEALFLRALCHFTLLEMFGEKGPLAGGGYPGNKDAQGIVLMMESATADNTYIGRSTVGQCYDAIIADLKAAESIIGDNQIPANHVYPTPGSLDNNYTKDVGWAQKPAVNAMLGKVYLFMNDYANAKIQFESVILDSRFALDKPVNFTDYIQHIDNNAESVYTLQFYDYNGTADAYTYGPSQSVTRINSNVPGAWKNTFIDNRTKNRFDTDPRIYEATMYDHGWSAWSTNATPPVFILLDVNQTGFRYYERKSINFFDYGSPRDNTKNIDVIRLADIYLMYAEAALNSGDAPEATEYVNKLRRRAWGETDYNTPATLGEDLSSVDMATIQEERYKELFFENVRWFDICRWGILQSELAKYPTTRAGVVTYDDKDYFMPMPESELTKNPLLKQSLGY